MLGNLHTHTTFCDGNNTPEEIVIAAIAKGFHSIGFSGHGYTPFDLRYCIKDMAGYISEIKRLQKIYADQIQIYLGIEEDAYFPTNRGAVDYIIGSSHYYCVGDQYYSIDSDFDGFRECLQLFHSDPVAMAHAYYQPFCAYLLDRKPDIVGHFDLITKFDELETSIFLEDRQYHKVAEEYMRCAVQSGCLFEVNTGAISRGYRTSVYPSENLLQIIRKNGNGVVLSSDSHSIDTLSFGFRDAQLWLKDLGFTHTYLMYNGQFIKNAF